MHFLNVTGTHFLCDKRFKINTTEANKRYIIKGSSKVKIQKSSNWRIFIPLGLVTGVCYIGYRVFYHKPDAIKLASNWQINAYRLLPLRATSRVWGRICESSLPPSIVHSFIRLYVWAFDCQMHEAIHEDITMYRTIGEFFRRELKSGLRTVDEHHLITSPADGRVLHFGRVIDGSLEQVKGVTFTLGQFLGPPTWDSSGSAHNAQNTHYYKNGTTKNSQTHLPLKDMQKSQRITAKEFFNNNQTIGDSNANFNCDNYKIPVRRGNQLYFCTVYLAPGDYHRFHSPASWTIQHRRHFPGELLSVSPGIMRWIRGLFNYNERAIYYGSWLHGFFAFAAIGATNVGSIKIYCDTDLETNQPRLSSQETFYDRQMKDNEHVSLAKGEMIGEFNMGSSLVVIFEAPETFTFNISQGCKVKVGEGLGTIK